MALDACPCSLELLTNNEEGKVVFTLLACTDSGSARIVRQELDLASSSDDNDIVSSATSHPSATLRMVTGTAASLNDNVSALAGRLLPGGEKNGGSLAWRCIVAYGMRSKPLFETVTYASGPEVSQLFPHVSIAGE